MKRKRRRLRNWWHCFYKLSWQCSRLHFHIPYLRLLSCEALSKAMCSEIWVFLTLTVHFSTCCSAPRTFLGLMNEIAWLTRSRCYRWKLRLSETWLDLADAHRPPREIINSSHATAAEEIKGRAADLDVVSQLSGCTGAELVSLALLSRQTPKLKELQICNRKDSHMQPRIPLG